MDKRKLEIEIKSNPNPKSEFERQHPFKLKVRSVEVSMSFDDLMDLRQQLNDLRYAGNNELIKFERFRDKFIELSLKK